MGSFRNLSDVLMYLGYENVPVSLCTFYVKVYEYLF